jgi:hypothetical protein
LNSLLVEFLLNKLLANELFVTSKAPRERKEVKDGTNHKKRENDDNIGNAKVGRRVRVWFSAQPGRREKYFVGIIGRDCGNDQFEMEWDDKRAKKHEVVSLKPENKTDDISNEDRWNYI